ncbi:MAG: AglZ/HisF2 family acetamidino modification protein [Sphaerochaetaceae bacterium]|nr:AglZ/HisF2 family acetamidino modification protein [Sphaerochaetaceae bacterium]
MYSRPRIIPCLTMINRGLVKTVKFKNPRYLGDPINTVKIFNGKYVDELCILDITASKEKKSPDFEYLKEIASEAFMPLSYGGGITSIDEIEKLFYMGYEKVILNTSIINNPKLIKEAVRIAGSQSIVASIDIKKDLLSKYNCYISDGQIRIKESPQELVKKVEDLGVGEILINSISNDGMMKGYDVELVNLISTSVQIPVIACGGAKDIYDIKKVLEDGSAHAAAAGSMFFYYGKQKAVLITVPSEEELFNFDIYKKE